LYRSFTKLTGNQPTQYSSRSQIQVTQGRGAPRTYISCLSTLYFTRAMASSPAIEKGEAPTPCYRNSYHSMRDLQIVDIHLTPIAFMHGTAAFRFLFTI
jgi:hypothetical protein